MSIHGAFGFQKEKQQQHHLSETCRRDQNDKHPSAFIIRFYHPIFTIYFPNNYITHKILLQHSLFQFLPQVFSCTLDEYPFQNEVKTILSKVTRIFFTNTVTNTFMQNIFYPFTHSLKVLMVVDRYICCLYGWIVVRLFRRKTMLPWLIDYRFSS